MPIIAYIPEKYEDGFEELSNISNEDFNKIKECLATIPLVSSINELAAFVTHKGLLNDIEIDEIFQSIGSIIPLIENEEVIDEMVDDIATIAETDDLVSADNKEEFKKRVGFLLNDKHIYYASKAEDLLNDYGNVFIKTRIITDIRPVFELNTRSTPSTGIIIHNLNIHYQSSEEPYHKDVSFVLNSNNIKALKDALIRAEDKEEVLRKVLDKAGITKLND